MHISKEIVHIAIAETSVIIRRGLSSTLESLASLRAHIVEVSTMEGLDECMQAHSPDILIVNSGFCGKFNLQQMRQAYPQVCYVELVTESARMLLKKQQEKLQAEYDAQLSLFADIGEVEEVVKKLSGQVYEEDVEDARSFGERLDNAENVLSQREREIVVKVVRGLTNKEIADELCISVHTVITHRKNISRKLQIHSAAGLTIYAIANKLIELKDLD